MRRELTLLERIAARIMAPRYNAARVSSVLAEAVSLSAARDKGLNLALEPLVDEILKTSLRKHQRDFVNVLFPLMGPSIRKSIAETFRSMLGNFSKSLEMAFSWRGLRWRLEAIRSGKPFGEIVLLHTLVYRVEQIFFIHSETGLVLSHLANEGVGAQDADMISAMLTAIQDFARDCFAAGSEGELEALRLGEFTILLEKSEIAYLACVVRGTPPAGFNARLRDVLEILLVEYADPLAVFNGDSEEFTHSVRYLDELMITRYAEDSGKIPLWAKAAPILLLLLLLGGFGHWKYQDMRLQAEMRQAITLMRSEPGLMLVSVSGDSAPWEVIAFKDELAEQPDQLLQKNGLDPQLFSFKIVPFISYDPAVVSKRAETSLELPEGVSMDYDGKGVITLKGTAPMLWILQARERARGLPGVEQVDIRQLRDPVIDELSAMVEEIESSSIEFPTGKDVPVPADVPKLEKVVDRLVELEQKAQEMGFGVSLTIYGHADSTGMEKRNYEISQARTRTVAAMLYARGSSMPIAMYGMGSKYPKGKPPALQAAAGNPAAGRGDQASRRIEMRVHLTRSATSDMDWFR